jgi:hypothetical protein
MSLNIQHKNRFCDIFDKKVDIITEEFINSSFDKKEDLIRCYLKYLCICDDLSDSCELTEVQVIIVETLTCPEYNECLNVYIEILRNKYEDPEMSVHVKEYVAGILECFFNCCEKHGCEPLN